MTILNMMIEPLLDLIPRIFYSICFVCFAEGIVLSLILEKKLEKGEFFLISLISNIVTFIIGIPAWSYYYELEKVFIEDKHGFFIFKIIFFLGCFILTVSTESIVNYQFLKKRHKRKKIITGTMIGNFITYLSIGLTQYFFEII